MGKKIYNWQEIQALYDTGISTLELKNQTGVSFHAIERAILRGDFIRRSRQQANGKPLDQLSRYDKVKRRILADGIVPNVCIRCGQLPEHNGLPLTLQIHHLDGNNKNNALDNIEILCPNCHTQTENYGRKKVSRKIVA